MAVMSVRSWLLLGLLAAIWGSSYLLIALGLRSFEPGMLAFLRVALAAALIVPFGVRYRHTLRGRWRALPLLAISQVAVPFVLISTAEQRLPSGLAGVLVASQPLWFVVISPLLGSGRPNWLSLIGTVAGFGGVALVVGYDAHGSVDPLAVAMMLGAALFYAFGAWYAKRTMTGAHPLAQTGATLVTASILIAPIAAFQLPTSVAPVPAAAVTVLALVGTGGAFVIYNRLIKDAGPGRASLVSYLAPGFALGYGAVVLHEPLGVNGVLGLALILAGSWLSTRTSLRRWARPAPTDQPVPVGARETCAETS